MAEYRAVICWSHSTGDFLRGTYSREHTWSFDGGVTVPASSAPSSVPIPYSNPACVDPEEAYVASISSCHMLTFLYLAGKAGWQIATYEDEAVGHLERDERGALWMARVELHPVIAYIGPSPDEAQEAALHEASHAECYIANSVRTQIEVV